MNDIYVKKAKKYKYKYLKLKQEYNGEGGNLGLVYSNHQQPHFTQLQSHFTQPQSHFEQLQPQSHFTQPHIVQPQSHFTQPQSHFTQPHIVQPQSHFAQPHIVQPQSHFAQLQPHIAQPQSHFAQLQPHIAQLQPQSHFTQPQSHFTQPHIVQPQSQFAQLQPQSHFAQLQPQSHFEQLQPHIAQPQLQPQPQSHFAQLQPQSRRPIVTNTSCVIIPAIQLTGLNIIEIHPNEDPIPKQINLSMYNNRNYVGKFVSCADNIFYNEIKNLIIVNKLDPLNNYTQKLCFAGSMYINELESYLQNDKNLQICVKNKYNTYKNQTHKNNNNNNNTICYLITKYIGEPFLHISTFTIIIQILQSLKDGIINFITKLYDKYYVLGDINLHNMTYYNQKVYFIDYGNMHNFINFDPTRHYIFSMNNNYSLVISMFYNIFFEYTTKNILRFQKHIIEKHFYKKDLIELMQINNNTNFKQYDSEKYIYIKNIIPNYADIHNTFIKKLFKSLPDDNLPLNGRIQEIYTKYIIPIAENSDIYALSIFIYDIIPLNNKLIARELVIAAIKNEIKHPAQLVDRLDSIISIISGTRPLSTAVQQVPIQSTAVQPAPSNIQPVPIQSIAVQPAPSNIQVQPKSVLQRQPIFNCKWGEYVREVDNLFKIDNSYKTKKEIEKMYKQFQKQCPHLFQ
jgi:hypothetical protein